jgi:hypothetical protein
MRRLASFIYYHLPKKKYFDDRNYSFSLKKEGKLGKYHIVLENYFVFLSILLFGKSRALDILNVIEKVSNKT